MPGIGGIPLYPIKNIWRHAVPHDRKWTKVHDHAEVPSPLSRRQLAGKPSARRHCSASSLPAPFIPGAGNSTGAGLGDGYLFINVCNAFLIGARIQLGFFTFVRTFGSSAQSCRDFFVEIGKEVRIGCDDHIRTSSHFLSTLQLAIHEFCRPAQQLPDRNFLRPSFGDSGGCN